MSDQTLEADVAELAHPEPVADMMAAGQAMTVAETMELARHEASMRLLPISLAEIAEFGLFLSKATMMVPQCFIGKPDACMAVVYQATRWETDPVATIGQAYLPNGGNKVGYQAQLIHALVESSPKLEAPLRTYYEGEGLQRRIVVVGRVKGALEDQVYPSPRILNIRPRNSPLWTMDPDQQLHYFGVRAWARRWMPDRLMGIYTPDELEAQAMLNVTPKEAAKVYDKGDLPEPSGGKDYVNPTPDRQQQKGENRGGMRDEGPPDWEPPGDPVKGRQAKPKQQAPQQQRQPPKGEDPWAGIEDIEEWVPVFKADLQKATTFEEGEETWMKAGQHGWFDKLAKHDPTGLTRRELNKLSEELARELKAKPKA